MEELSKFASPEEDLPIMKRKLIEDAKRFGREISRGPFPKEEGRSTVIIDRGPSLGDAVERAATFPFDRDVGLDQDLRRTRGADRIPWILFVGKDRIVGPSSALSAGAQGDLRGSPFRMLRCDLDLLHELSHRAFPGNTGWPLIGHGPAPRIA